MHLPILKIKAVRKVLRTLSDFAAAWNLEIEMSVMSSCWQEMLTAECLALASSPLQWNCRFPFSQVDSRVQSLLMHSTVQAQGFLFWKLQFRKPCWTLYSNIRTFSCLTIRPSSSTLATHKRKLGHLRKMQTKTPELYHLEIDLPRQLETRSSHVSRKRVSAVV